MVKRLTELPSDRDRLFAGDESVRGCDRRTFLKKLGTWSCGVLLSSVSVKAFADDCGFSPPIFSRPPLPDACLQPVTDLEKVLAAVVDTVVPGVETDPEGAPGGLEACAVNLLLDEYYPFREYAETLAFVMNLLANDEGSSAFVDLNYEKRLKVLIAAIDQLPILRLAYRAIRAAFFGGAYNGVGLSYLNYPGPNLGYRHLAECSFRKPMCEELTDTGWMP